MTYLKDKILKECNNLEKVVTKINNILNPLIKTLVSKITRHLLIV